MTIKKVLFWFPYPFQYTLLNSKICLIVNTNKVKDNVKFYSNQFNFVVLCVFLFYFFYLHGRLGGKPNDIGLWVDVG